MALLVFYVTLALGVSFLCSVMEAVLLSVTPAFVAQTERQNPRVGTRLKAFKDDIDRPLAAILSLNTIAHTVGAAGAGAQAAAIFGNQFVGVISAVLTFLILVLSEIIPKTLGAVYWRQLAPAVVRVLVPTMTLMWPLVRMAQSLTRLLARGKKQVLVSREELTALADLGAQEGVVLEEESRIVKNLFRFGQVRVHDIMTPRTVVFALPASQTVSEALEANPEIRFSRLPLYGDNRDDIHGFVLKSDLLLHAAEQRSDQPLSELARPLELVPETRTLRSLFELLMDKRAHIALVVDEYGGTSGIVTMEDLVETLLGLEIVDEADAVQDMQELARQKWRERAARLGLAVD
ncbi:MAG: HlyC/CorC family transporter [bacterium]|nr:HlyC/CorC family transporter [bacterium]